MENIRPDEQDYRTEIVRAFLESIGEDPEREGLKETPARVVRSWGELFRGYSLDPRDVLTTTFRDGATDEMVILKNIDFASTCEHHVLPFFGKVSIGYIPRRRIVGISKLARLVEVFARRLQIQERMTTQIADSIMKILKPRGCMVVVEATHLCMVIRGVNKANSVMRTQAVRGNFIKPDVKEEFLKGIKRG